VAKLPVNGESLYRLLTADYEILPLGIGSLSDDIIVSNWRKVARIIAIDNGAKMSNIVFPQ